MSDKFKHDVNDTVQLHIHELRRMVADDEISEADHDTIGLILTAHIGQLIGLSDKAWAMFAKIVNESREVHYNR